MTEAGAVELRTSEKVTHVLLLLWYLSTNVSTLFELYSLLSLCERVYYHF